MIPVAELSRPTLAAPLMLSELPDTAPVDDSVAPATVPVAVSAAGDCARGVHARGEHVGAVHVVAHVALHGEPVQRGRAREGQRVRQQVRHGDRLSLKGRGPNQVPGIEPPKAPKRFRMAAPKSRRAVLQTPCEAVPRKVPVTPT